MDDIAVTINGVSKRYGSLIALDNISLQVPRGSFYGLLGPNGAGKTTLIGILGGLISPATGSGQVLGRDIVRDTIAVRHLIGIVPQEPVYDPFFNVREALVFQSKYYGIHDNNEWIDTLLDKLQLKEKSDTNTRALSGGMKRRLMIAQALVHKPPVIVLDEPTAGVDINLRLSLWHFIRELNSKGHTIILTTHYLEEAEALCESVALINHGKIVTADNTRQLLAYAGHSVRVRIRAGGGDPAALPAADKTEPDGAYLYTLNDYQRLEPLLAAFRAAGSRIEEISVTPPKLEDVFIQTMRQQQ